MGAQFDETTLSGDLTPDEAVKAAQDVIQQSAWENGHGGYTGTLAEVPGAQLTGQTVKSLQEARELLDGKQSDDGGWNDGLCEKWEPALLVRVEPDDGPALWYLGALCSS